MLPLRVTLLLLAGSLSEDLAPPASAHLVRQVEGQGVQIYRCAQAADTAFSWTLVAPEAKLVDPANGTELGSHGAGPVWRWADGSAISGSVLKRVPSPDTGSIPWLLLEAKSIGTPGLLSAVGFVQRSATHGGNPPASPCDAEHGGSTTRVPYTATYSFFSTTRQLP